MRLPCDAVLLLIDVQSAIRALGVPPGDDVDAAARIGALLAAWRAESLPIVHVERDLNQPASPRLSEACPQEGETILGRFADSAFEGTDLEVVLDGFGATTLVVCGILASPSLDASLRDAAGLGYRLFVVADACRAAGQAQELPFGGTQRQVAEIVDCAMALRAAAMANMRRRKR